MPQSISHASLFNLSPNPYMVLDREFVFVDANDAYLEVTGRTREELIGRNLFDAFPGNPDDPDDASVQQLRASLQRVLRDRKPHHLALIRYAIPFSENGSTVFDERYWSATHVPVLDEHGEVSGILQHTVDVTELQQLKMAARAAEQGRVGALTGAIEGQLFERAQAVQAHRDVLDAQLRYLQRLFDQSPGFLTVLRGPLHVFELANRAYYQLVGHRELIGRSVRDALPEIGGQGYFELLDRVYQSGEPFIGQGMKAQLQREPGAAPEERFIDLIYQPVVEEDGSISGILAQGHDVTPQYRTQQELQRYRSQLEELLQQRTVALEQSRAEHAETQAQLEHVQRLEALGRLTGGVAHDFNNLLQVLNNSLMLLHRLVGDEAKAQRWITVARNAVASGSKLTGQLLAFARRQPLEPQVINVGRLLRGMDDLLRRAVGETVQLQTHIAADLWNTSADPNQLENVILNLAINARDAMEGRGSLTLDVGNAVLDASQSAARRDVAAGQYVLLAIGDTGPGMAPEVFERAFEPFFSTKGPGKGTGLGLSMVYGFVKQSGGHIEIDNRPGRGITINIYLPRADQSERHPELRVAGPVSGGSETILVVEDDPAVLETTVESLTDLGYHVLKAHDGESAMSIVASGVPIDLLFTDVIMPGPVGAPELARRAKAALPHLEVLYTSGYTEDGVVHGGRLDPGVQLISKPYGRDPLARRIRKLLKNAADRKRPPPPTSMSTASDVLFVEDELELQLLGVELLRSLGHRVVAAASAEAALELLKTDRFDVLLSDVALPGMSGVELARAVREQAPHMRIVLASGYGRTVLPTDDEIAADTLLLPKPYSLDGLKKALDQVRHEVPQGRPG